MTIKLTRKQRIIVRSSDDVFKVMKEILLREDKIDREKEHFWVVGLAQNHRIRYVELISMGGVRYTTVEPMNVFRWSVMKGCVKVIMVHNHPSGDLKPSVEDKGLTDRLIQVGRILDINVLDHLIISTKSYMSFANTGLLSELEKSTQWVPTFELIERIRTEEKKIREEAVRVAEEKGIKKGKLEGEKKKAIEMARNSIKEGLPVELIVKLTGLTKKEIEKIKV
ncbi:MAG: DNA repair protein [Bacteroidales bacterium]|nr:DNA repair protein [Bacteroidales bacterium]